MGTVCGSPYTAAVEEKTKRETLCLSITRNSVSVRSELLSKYCSGTLTDSPASMSAAKCMTASKRWLAKSWIERGFVSGVGVDEFGAGGNGFAPSHDEVVEDGDGVSGAQKMVGDDTADVAGSAGDENSHESPSRKLRFVERSAGRDPQPTIRSLSARSCAASWPS